MHTSKWKAVPVAGHDGADANLIPCTPGVAWAGHHITCDYDLDEMQPPVEEARRPAELLLPRALLPARLGRYPARRIR